MSKFFAQVTSWAWRKQRERRDADRIALAIARDQLVAWAEHPRSRRRGQALRGWADILQSVAA